MEGEKRTWQETLDLLRYDYTLSIRDVCKLLKASRSWVNRYIKPHVRSIYINSNKRAGGTPTFKCNWVQLAALELEKPDMTESTWLNTDDVMDLLRRSVVSITKQTKSVPVKYLMTEDDRKQYDAEYAELKKLMALPMPADLRAELWRDINVLHLKYVDGDEKKLLKNTCSITKRGDVERIEVEYPGEFDPTQWIAAHDIKEYGDTDEDVYRKFFRGGFIRIELSMPDENGEVGSKVYYIADPDPIPGDGKTVIVSERAWREYAARN